MQCSAGQSVRKSHSDSSTVTQTAGPSPSSAVSSSSRLLQSMDAHLQPKSCSISPLPSLSFISATDQKELKPSAPSGHTHTAVGFSPAAILWHTKCSPDKAGSWGRQPNASHTATQRCASWRDRGWAGAQSLLVPALHMLRFPSHTLQTPLQCAPSKRVTATASESQLGLKRSSEAVWEHSPRAETLLWLPSALPGEPGN